MNHYKDTTQQPNTLETLKNGQIDTSTKVTLFDVIKSISLAVLIIALLLFITTLQQAHPKNSLLLVAGMGQNITLSKTNSDTPNRYPLAFFMPKYRLTSQVSDNLSITHLTHFTGLNRHTYAQSVTSYGGVTLQNKRKPICRAVTVCTESEPRHPMTFHSVVLTQKQIGGYHA
ncbi:hypothetical protein HG532_03710 [Moraxella osloensis]|nr:hypothetical protein [Moraxella osloensis]MBW4009134.1 hypothetical protein [Moraxella osloensis]